MLPVELVDVVEAALVLMMTNQTARMFASRCGLSMKVEPWHAALISSGDFHAVFLTLFFFSCVVLLVLTEGSLANRHFKLGKDEVALLDSQSAAAKAFAEKNGKGLAANGDENYDICFLERAVLTRVAIQGHERD
jgi:hypothetical protein